MTRQLFVGIDPGANGGLAAIDENMKVYALSRMPSSPEEILLTFGMFTDLKVYAVLEQVSGYAGVEHPGSRMFPFGQNYGHLEMALWASGFQGYSSWVHSDKQFRKNLFVVETPQKWQKMLGLRKKEKGETDTSWKGYLKREAQSYFPKIKVTLKTADALLLAVVCRMLFLREAVPEDK